MVRHKIGALLTEPITRTLDLNDEGVVKQPIEEYGSDGGPLPRGSALSCRLQSGW